MSLRQGQADCVGLDQGLTIQFDGGQSFDPNGLPLTYAWDFGGLGTSTQADPSFTFQDDGTYTVTLLLAQGSYQYKFVVDGNWKHDPNNPNTTDDGFGGQNSVLDVDASFSTIEIELGDGKIYSDDLEPVFPPGTREPELRDREILDTFTIVAALRWDGDGPANPAVLRRLAEDLRREVAVLPAITVVPMTGSERTLAWIDDLVG